MALFLACSMMTLAACSKDKKASDSAETAKVQNSESAGTAEENKTSEDKEVAQDKQDADSNEVDDADLEEKEKSLSKEMGASNYFYQQLTKEEKKFFIQIVYQSEAYLSDKNAMPQKPQNSAYNYCYGTFDIGSLTKDRAQQLAELFYCSCPRYFFAAGALSWVDDQTCSMCMWDDYADRDALNALQEKVEARTTEWMAKINACKGDLEKEKMILKLLGENVESGETPRLDSDGKPLKDDNGKVISNWNNQFIVGPLVDGKAYGNGYSKAMQYLSSLAGLDCLYIQAPAEAGHCWNMIKIGEDWFCVDAHLFDADGMKSTSKHFNKSLETFKTAWEGQVHYINSKYTDFGMTLPSCDKDTVDGEEPFFTGDNGDFTIDYGELKSYNGTDTDVVIPDNVAYIDAVVFNVDHDILSFEVDENNPYFCAVDGVLFSKDKETLVCYPKAKEGPYTVPEGTKKIADRAFLYNAGVTSLTLPDGLEVIGAGALLFNANITEMNLPDSLKEIGFQSMGAAKFLDGQIILPKDLKEVYGYAFMNTGMTEVVVSDGMTRLLDDTFLGCESLKTVYLPAGIKTMGPNVFEGCTSLTDIYFAGTQEQWEAIDTSSAQIPSDCEIHYETHFEANAE